jgi:hypothetical protein
VSGGTLLGESWPTIEAILKPLERVVLVGLVALSAAAVAWKIRGHLRGESAGHARRRDDLTPEPVAAEDR